MSGSGRMSVADRKRAQRQRDKLMGWVEVSVKVAKSHAQEIRDYAASLPPPAPPTDPTQLSLLAQLDAALSDESRPDGGSETGRQGKLL
jgi:hypothetical protein